MNENDFIRLKHIEPKDITGTGATIESMKIETVTAIDRFITLSGLGLIYLYNGMTTGEHLAKEHPAGLAIDFTTKKPFSDQTTILCLLLQSGFRGIGIYKNERGVFSYHADLRPQVALWKGKKVLGNWDRTPMLSGVLFA